MVIESRFYLAVPLTDGWGACCQLGDLSNNVKISHTTWLQLDVNGWILRDRKVPLSKRLKLFDTVVSPVACFAAGTEQFTNPIYSNWMLSTSGCFEQW